MHKKVVGQNLYGWVMLKLTCFLIIPTLAGVMVLGDIIIMLFTNQFIPLLSALTLFYTIYRFFSGYQYIHSSIGDDVMYLRLDEMEYSAIYSAFSIISPNNYELQVFRTLGASSDAALSVDTRNKVATIYLREEVFQVLKVSEEYSAVILPQIVKEAYSWFKYNSVASTVHFDGMIDSVERVRINQTSEMKNDNSLRTGVLVGAIAGGVSGAALGGVVGAGAKTTKGAPVALFMIFALAGLVYFLSISFLLWFFQFPYNRKISRELKDRFYQPVMNGKEKKEIRKIKRQADSYPRELSDNDDDYSKDRGWILVV
ncbi:MAG: hypothetical protein CSH37_11280 [Thalassolituus sp.]|jgi:hypothetical protein|nr:MAG: hypothetical protein CSH37_11280 [Thalassolituus sp.]|tara:strand:+ start:1248 stop:2189 length:942 start_codon:yes stop_codon:yes gene_type:complete